MPRKWTNEIIIHSRYWLLRQEAYPSSRSRRRRLMLRLLIASLSPLNNRIRKNNPTLVRDRNRLHRQLIKQDQCCGVRYSIKRKTTILNPIYSETWLTVIMPQRRNKKIIFAAYARFSRISRVKDSRRNRWHARNGQIVDSIRAILAVITKLIWLTQKPSPPSAPSKRSKASCK